MIRDEQVRENFVGKIIPVLAEDGAEIRWNGDQVQIFNSTETITIVFEITERR